VTEPQVWQALGVALAAGLLVGAERERSKAGQGAAGVRTFGAVALLGALASLVSEVAIVVALAAVGLLAVASYLRTSEVDPGMTTEASLLVVFALGALALTRPAVCVGGAVATTVVLASKERLHRFLRRTVTDTELSDALKFFVAAFVVLPLLPSAAVGPYGAINPRQLWTLVVAVTAIGWAGYIAVRLVGVRHGLLLAGFAGGFVSGPGATASVAARGRRHGTTSAAVGGALAASASSLVQLAIVTALVSVPLSRRLAPGIITGVVLLTATAVLAARSRVRHVEEAVPSAGRPVAERPFSFGPAILLAVVITAVLVLARWGSETFGPSGAVVVAAVGGVADSHATALGIGSVVATGGLGLQTATQAVVAALLAGTVTKLVLAVAAGGWRVGLRVAALLVPSMLVTSAVLLWAR
jgi:uncharacterized membrane protein (DUF4010 family)